VRGLARVGPGPRFGSPPDARARPLRSSYPVVVFGSFGRVLVVMGGLIALLGFALIAAERFPWLRIGRLPGDIHFERGNFSFYFPLATSVLLSIVLTLLLWLLGRR
jgi:hypothetical protein